MELDQNGQAVERIHVALLAYQGRRLKVKANMGRSKIFECVGTVMQAHPQLFVLEVERKRGRLMRQSYQYVDVLTGMVELMCCETGESIFDDATLITSLAAGDLSDLSDSDDFD